MARPLGVDRHRNVDLAQNTPTQAEGLARVECLDRSRIGTCGVGEIDQPHSPAIRCLLCTVAFSQFAEERSWQPCVLY